MQAFANTVGNYIGQGIDFIMNPNNLPITIGMVIIFAIILFLMKGTGHIIDTAFFLILSFFVISCLCGELGIELDIAGILHQVVQFFVDVFGGITSAA